MAVKKIDEIKGLNLGLASPERIRSWSHGEVTRSETINYKTLKPERGGLFDEAIFGPIKDFECSCGKYKKVKYRGKVCERCGVEITESIVRRERMGHIELPIPVAHTWMIKELPNPSKISLLLDIPYKEVEQVVYFVNYIILDDNGNPNFKTKDVIDLNNVRSSKANRIKLRKILMNDIMKKLDKNSFDYGRASDYAARLQDSSLPFSIEEVFNFITKYAGIKFGIGAEAIQTLLRQLDLQSELNYVQKQLKKTDPNKVEFRKLIRRVETIKWFIESNNKPEWMILNVIPVTPPDTRPIVQLDGGKFTTSDINNFYRKIIIRNERLKHLISLNAPTIILNNEKRMLQESVDALFDNASRSKPVMSKDHRVLKSLTDHLKGKQGLFRQNLLGKRVDYSGRSVIVVGPELKLTEAGIPTEMILKLFKPYIIHELIRRTDDIGNEIKPIASNVKIAEQMIMKEDDQIWDVVRKVIKQRPVLLNRAPTLHRLGIQAFEPQMVAGKAIRLHPLACAAFNADFDGDQMAVHLPITDDSVKEARSDLMAATHILGPKDGKPIITPSQDMLIGIYYLSSEVENGKGQGTIFANVNEALKAYQLGAVSLRSVVGISTKAYPEKTFAKQGIIITTIGKIIINNALPASFNYVNDINGLISKDDLISFTTNIHEVISKRPISKPFAKKSVSNLILMLHRKYPDAIVSSTMDKIKDLGFKYSTKSGITMSVFDIPSYNNKYEYFVDADKQVAKFRKQFAKGLLTDDERYTKVVTLWNDVKGKVTKDIEKIMNDPANAHNSVIIMANSGARGNVSQFTQLLGMRGLMNRSYNYERKTGGHVIKDTIEVPIKDSFIDGLTISEYYNSSYGARKGMADTAMKTSKSGYMTRKLVDAAQEVIVTEDDCHTTKGVEVSAIIDTFENVVIESLYDRIVNRYSMDAIFNPKTNEQLVGPNEIITPEIAKAIEACGIEKVMVRSAIHCKAKNGICRHCFGNDLTTNKPIEIGTAIGVVAAQSIGEPGTQLNLRTFHTGGASGSAGGNIAQGFERLKQLFDMIPPKDYEIALISEVDGTIMSRTATDDGYIIEVETDTTREVVSYKAPLNAVFRVKVGDHVSPGDKITNGSVNINELLRVAGIKAARDYLLKEVQKVYRLQGIEISDKYIEIIIRQMTNKMKVLNPGDSEYFIGQIININDYINVNNQLLVNGQHPITAVNIIYGLDEIPAHSDSFLSAASFQDTKKILTDAAIKNQFDYLKGLKENVMLGRLIPAGTGLKKYKE